MLVFSGICEEIGVPLAKEKTVGPVTRLTFLGIDIDTEEFRLRIPDDKLVKMVVCLKNLVGKRKVTLHELQSLTGTLNFVCRAVRPGRAFLRRMYDAMCGIREKHHYIRITKSLREDMLTWLHFLENFNGETFFPESEWLSSDTLNLFTDSSGNGLLGCGAYFAGQWVYFGWPKAWENKSILADITFLELVPIVIALELWGFRFSNKRLLLHVDNMALVRILNTCTSKSKRVMSLIRPLLMVFLKHNIVFRATHVRSQDNGICDSISRQQWERFRQLAPEADENPLNVPNNIIEKIYSMKLTD
ncbi:hypothetical protein SNE40_007726 [Patella caerulea]|uniref:Reverse transcriptase RNase H-like domain-containing protein n=1 Tax=Patella caerulea TaxID=87958 RepID=A0AAN8K461_PATCE